MNSFEYFIELCSYLCRKEDYKDKKKIKRHNEAIQKLNKLKTTMLSTSDKSKEVWKRLLCYNDDMVRLLSASICLDESLYNDEAKNVLLELAMSANDETIKFSAKMKLPN